MDTLQFVGPLRRGVARIGRSGTKLHPVIERVYTGAGGERKFVDFCCTCTGTCNGRAHNTAQVFFGSNESNCGNSASARTARRAA